MIRAWVVLALASLAPWPAAGYPHFQLSSGEARCSSCHYSPVGGGLLNDHGRHESVKLSAGGLDTESDDAAAFLHGSVPLAEWLALGGEARLAGLTNAVSHGDREWLVIPMQADVYGRASSGGLSINASAGLRGAARPTGQPAASYLISREHYVMWQPEDTGLYARAGRFMPPFGLRLADHTAYVRRYQDLDLLDESYGAGLGYVVDAWEIHASAFLFSPLADGTQDRRGGSVQAEVRLGPGAYGAGVYAAASDSRYRGMGGLTAKLYLAPADLMLLAELDVGRDIFPLADNAYRNQLASYAAAVFSPSPGWYLTAAHEFFAEDLKSRSTARHAFAVSAAYHPRTHWEFLLQARYQLIGPADWASVALLMAHYYL